MARLSLYLSDEENAAARELARNEGASLSSVVRVALRQLVGLPIPRGWVSLVDGSRDEEPSERG